MTALITFLGGIRASVFAVLLVLVLVFAAVQTVRVGVLKDTVAEQEQEAAALVVAQDLALAERDLEHQKAVSTLRDSYATDTKLALQRRDATIASLRAGTLSLQKRFSCPSVPGAVAGTPGGSDGASGSGLLDSDAEFLVRFASEADEVVRKLTMAQGIVASCTKERE